ncbi:MAG: cysteine desulfurase family protein [candidate division Zixibacteria bacterium]
MTKGENFVFFDNINTTFPDPEVVDIISKTLDARLGNPASHVHTAGINAGALVDKARSLVSDFISGSDGSIIFTSGATESNNLALSGFLSANNKFQLAVTPIEHFSILNQSFKLRNDGVKIRTIVSDSFGSVDLDSLEHIVAEGPTLVSIALANPEIGTVQDMGGISEICRKYGAVLHSDCTAAARLIDIDVNAMGIDMITLSAHNIYGPTGAGALYMKKGITVSSLFVGGNQEDGIRPGTENVIGIAGFGEACRIAKEGMESYRDHLSRLGRKLWNGLADSIQFIHFTGHEEDRLPGHVSFWVEHVEGESLLLLLNMNGIMASSGSACSSNLKGKDENDLAASHVLTAVGVPTDICAGSITFAMGKNNTEDEVDFVLETMPKIVKRLLAMSPSYDDYKKGKEIYG